MTMAMLAMAFAFTSCGSDDDDDPKADTNMYGKAIVKIPESVFQYATATLVLEYDGKTESHPLNESTKVANDEDLHGAARVIEHVFTFKADPAKAHIKYELTEAGKQKIADEPEGKADHRYLTAFVKVPSPTSVTVALNAGGYNGIKHAGYAQYLQDESKLTFTFK